MIMRDKKVLKKQNVGRVRFNEWKRHVKQHLPSLMAKYWNHRLAGLYVSADTEREIGQIIDAINDPFYSVALRSSDTHILETMLRKKVANMFKFIMQLPNQNMS